MQARTRQVTTRTRQVTNRTVAKTCFKINPHASMACWIGNKRQLRNDTNNPMTIRRADSTRGKEAAVTFAHKYKATPPVVYR
jgi:hypothetical protein